LRRRLSILSAIIAKSRDWFYATSVRIAAKRAAEVLLPSPEK
jgi:hypothetical protein